MPCFDLSTFLSFLFWLVTIYSLSTIKSRRIAEASLFLYALDTTFHLCQMWSIFLLFSHISWRMAVNGHTHAATLFTHLPTFSVSSRLNMSFDLYYIFWSIALPKSLFLSILWKDDRIKILKKKWKYLLLHTFMVNPGHTL